MNTLIRTRSVALANCSVLNLLKRGKQRLIPRYENVTFAAAQWNKLNVQCRQINSTGLLGQESVSKPQSPIHARMEAEEFDKNEIRSTEQQPKKTILQMFQERNRFDHDDSDLKSAVETILKEVEDSPADKVFSTTEIESLTRIADRVALKAMQTRELARHDDEENGRKEKRSRNLTVYNIEEIDSAVVEKRIQYDEESVEHFFRENYGFNNIKVTALHRYQKTRRVPRPLLIRLESEDIVQQLLAARKEQAAQGIQPKIWFTYEKSKLDMNFNKLLWLERNLRNKISEIKSDPWRWTIKGSRVAPVLDSTNLNHRVILERMADELRALTARFKEIGNNDKHEYQARLKRQENVIVLNIEESLENRAESDRIKVEALFDELGLDFESVIHIERVGWTSSINDIEPLRLVIPDPKIRLEFVKQSGRLRQSKEQWMKSVYVNLDNTVLKKYLQYHLRSEMKLRNTIAKITNEGYYWMIKRERVVRNIL